MKPTTVSVKVENKRRAAWSIIALFVFKNFQHKFLGAYWLGLIIIITCNYVDWVPLGISIKWIMDWVYYQCTIPNFRGLYNKNYYEINTSIKFVGD